MYEQKYSLTVSMITGMKLYHDKNLYSLSNIALSIFFKNQNMNKGAMNKGKGGKDWGWDVEGG